MRVARTVLPVLLMLGVVVPPAAAQHVEHLDSLLVRIGASSLGEPVMPGTWAEQVAQARALGVATSGELRVVVVPALFADSPEPETDPAHLDQVFFGDGPATLAAFYEAASGGVFTVKGTAAPWVRTSVTHEDGTGGPDNVLGIGPEFGRYLVEALDSADVHLDFREFDGTGNGFVDVLVFMFGEVPRSCGGDGVWPHFSSIAPRNNGEPWVSTDTAANGEPIKANAYMIIGAAECDGTPVERVAVLAHELGHQLGLPDIYHPIGAGLQGVLPENRRWVLGCFDIMAAGAWGCGPVTERQPFGPTLFSPWSRERLGWIDKVLAGSNLRRATFTLPPVQTSHRVLEIMLDAGGRESFLIEYRPAAGFDADLPASGVLIYRYNRDASLRPEPTGPRRYLIGLIEADSDSALVRTHNEGGNRGVAGDLFARNGAVNQLSNTTVPSARRVDGTPTAVTIHAVAIVNGAAEVVISTAETPGVVVTEAPPAVAAEPFAMELLVGGGAAPWSASLAGGTFPSGLTARVEADRLAVSGTPEEMGAFDVQVQITDARGVGGTTVVPLVVHAAELADADLLSALVRASGLTDSQRRLLDNEGNRNGRLDVGDVRAWLSRTQHPGR